MKLTKLISTDLMRHLGLVLEMDVYRSLAARLGRRGHEMSKERRARQNYGMQSVHVLQYMLRTEALHVNFYARSIGERGTHENGIRVILEAAPSR